MGADITSSVDDVDAWIEAGRRSAPAVREPSPRRRHGLFSTRRLCHPCWTRRTRKRLARAYAENSWAATRTRRRRGSAPPRPPTTRGAAACCASPRTEGSLERRMRRAAIQGLRGQNPGLRRARRAGVGPRGCRRRRPPGRRPACCANALPASEGSLEKEDVERLSKAYAEKIACDEPYPYAARGVDQDRARARTPPTTPPRPRPRQSAEYSSLTRSTTTPRKSACGRRGSRSRTTTTSRLWSGAPPASVQRTSDAGTSACSC